MTDGERRRLLGKQASRRLTTPCAAACARARPLASSRSLLDLVERRRRLCVTRSGAEAARPHARGLAACSAR